MDFWKEWKDAEERQDQKRMSQMERAMARQLLPEDQKKISEMMEKNLAQTS